MGKERKEERKRANERAKRVVCYSAEGRRRSRSIIIINEKKRESEILFSF
jgi:hypothetical protein